MITHSMTLLDHLRAAPGYWYLASPYSKYPDGLEAACIDICVIAARLIRAGVHVFSPIAHTHPIADYGGIDPLDHDIWLPLDAPMMEAAHGLIVAQMEGWQDSIGVAVEIKAFAAAGKPIVYLDPAKIGEAK